MKRHVLYVEDDESDRFLMEKAFAKEGVVESLRMVGSGEEAIDYLSGKGVYADREQHPFPAVVLLDLNLGPVHGFEVLNWIRTQSAQANLPVVVFSSSVREEDHAEARRLGANRFITKPSLPSRFVEVVRMLKERWLDSGGGAENEGVYSGTGRPNPT